MLNFVRRAAAVLGVAALAGGGMLLTSAPAAAEALISADVTMRDGLGPFDAADGPGLDASDSNKIARTNDLVFYDVAISANGGDVVAPLTLHLTLPQGVELTNTSWLSNPTNAAPALPGFCDPAASSVTTIAPPAPVVAGESGTATNDAAVNGLSATSWTALPQQEITCVVNNPATVVAAGSAQTFEFVTRVRSEVPNGTVLGNLGLTIDKGPNVSAVEVSPYDTSLTVSAAPKLDIGINGGRAYAEPNSAFVKQGTVQKCSYPDLPNTWCWVGGYPITVAIPDGGRGSIPLEDGAFSFDILTDPVTLWGQAAVDAAAAVGAELPGGYVTMTFDHPYDAPNSYPGTLQTSARDSGNITFTQGTFTRLQNNTQPNGANTWAANAGEPVTVTVTGADTTGYTIPFKTSSPNADLPTDGFFPESGFIFTQRVFLEVPLTTDLINALDNVAGVDADPADGQLELSPNFSVDPESLTFTTITGETDEDNIHDDGGITEANNYRQMQARLANNMVATSQWLSPVGYPTATDHLTYSPWYAVWQGPTGPAGRNNGDGVAVIGQEVISSIHIDGDNFADSSTLICQSFDNTKVNINPTPGYSFSPGLGMQNVGSDTFVTSPDGRSPYSDGTVWISGSMYNFTALPVPTSYAETVVKGKPTYNGMQDRFEDFRVEYGVGTNLDETCSGVTWYDSVNAVAPEQITHVRIYVEHEGATNAMYQRTEIAIPMKVVGGVPGDLIETQTSFSQTAGFGNYDAMIAAPYEYPSMYNATDNTDERYDGTPRAGSLSGDRLTLVGAAVRLDKSVETGPATGSYTSDMQWVPATQLWQDTPQTTIPTYGPGQIGHYQLTPSILSNPVTSEPVDFLVEDCMPTTYLEYHNDGSGTLPTFSGLWGKLEGLPYTPKITCNEGDFYMAWQFNDVVPTSTTFTLPTISIPFRVLNTAPPISGLVNTAEVWSPTDFSSLEQRQDKAKINIDAPAGLRISKIALPPLVTVDQNGWVATPTISWVVTLRAANNPNPTTNFDMIDLLPVDGLNDSSFTGTGDFVSASFTDENAVASSEPILLYTAAAAPTTADAIATWTNPMAPANMAGGTHVWCTAPDGTGVEYFSGTANAACPASPADVTGLRVIRPGAFGEDEVLTLTIETDATGNLGGQSEPPVDGEAGDVMVNTTQARADQLDVPMLADAQATFVTQAVTFNTGMISGHVWDDPNHDGIWGEGEQPIPGATVTLTPAPGSLDPNCTVTEANPCELQPVTVTTEPDGSYTFKGLFVDVEYTLSFGTPEGWDAPTLANVPRDAADPSKGVYSVGETHTVTLTPDTQYIRDIDSGFLRVGELALDKTVAAADGTTPTSVGVGDTLTYTVEVTNVGEHPFTDTYPASFIDDQAKILALGELEGTPTATVTLEDGTTAPEQGAVSSFESLTSWTGPLPVGATVKLTYTVLVTGEAGDVLENIAFTTTDPSDPDVNGGVPTPVPPAGDQPGSPTPTPTTDTCAAPSCDFTATPILAPALEVAKTVEGASSEAGAVVGDTLTYRVTGTNTGERPFTDALQAVLVDSLGDVLDAATLVDGSLTATVDGQAAGTLTLSSDGQSILWHGPLAAGQSVVITYQVKVESAGDGDAQNIAFTVPPAATPEGGSPVDPKNPPSTPTPEQ